MLAKLAVVLKTIFKRGSKEHFINSAKSGTRVLDVGCGNNGAKKLKLINGSLHYVGIDIQDYNFEPGYADEYIIVEKEIFAKKIASMVNIDYIICAHNLEHVDNPFELLNAFSKCVSTNGELFLSFPSEKSINFPSRKGTLNYYDDTTHNNQVPDFDLVLDQLNQGGFETIHVFQNYQPFFMSFLGFLMEPVSKYLGKVMPGTWAYYGFETIIWAKKNAD